jgi:hypothetical protein
MNTKIYSFIPYLPYPKVTLAPWSFLIIASCSERSISHLFEKIGKIDACNSTTLQFFFFLHKIPLKFQYVDFTNEKDSD